METESAQVQLNAFLSSFFSWSNLYAFTGGIENYTCAYPIPVISKGLATKLLICQKSDLQENRGTKWITTGLKGE